MDVYTDTLALRALCALSPIIGQCSTYKHFESANTVCTLRALSVLKIRNAFKVQPKCTSNLHFQTAITANGGRLLTKVQKVHKVHPLQNT